MKKTSFSATWGVNPIFFCMDSKNLLQNIDNMQ